MWFGEVFTKVQVLTTLPRGRGGGNAAASTKAKTCRRAGFYALCGPDRGQLRTEEFVKIISDHAAEWMVQNRHQVFECTEDDASPSPEDEMLAKLKRNPGYKALIKFNREREGRKIREMLRRKDEGPGLAV